MSVYIMGRKREGWQVVIRGYGWYTRSHLLTLQQAIRLQDYCRRVERKERANA
ncbi:MAG: hypothetical protein PHO67_08450 [Candidatus Omnitrophica bacterium]|nr:hypothetical protein [Candidatus Omnitrophota bacterium]